MFSVELFDRDFRAVRLPWLDLGPVRYSAQAVGGPDVARLRLSAPDDELGKLLRYGVIVRSQSGAPVWWGFIEEVIPARARGRHLREMYNRVSVLFSGRDAGGNPSASATDWAEDADSIARWGIRERRATLSDGTTEEAEAMAATAVQQLARRTHGPGLRGGSSEPRLYCRGWYSTLDWRYYSGPGRLLFEAEAKGEELIGFEVSGQQIGFNAEDNSLRDAAARLGALPKGTVLRVAGSAANSGDLVVRTAAKDEEPIRYESRRISFSDTDDIFDAANGLGRFEAGEIIRVTGSSAGNNLIDFVGKADNHQIEIEVGTFSAEGAGAPIEIVAGNGVLVEQDLAMELPGPAITVSSRSAAVEYQFEMPAGESWRAGEIAVRARRVGDAVDALRVSLHANGGSAPGGLLATGTVAGQRVPREMDWVAVTLTPRVTLSSAQRYWVVVERTGARAAGCYAVGLDEERGQGGSLWLNGIGGRRRRATPADLPHQIWAYQESSAQIERIVYECGQFLRGTDVDEASGVHGRQWRRGNLSARAELEKLIGLGTASRERLIAAVSPQRTLKVARAASSSRYSDWRLAADGRLLNSMGLPVEAGVLPAGRWVYSEPDQETFFVERAEYEVASGSLELEPPQEADPLEVLR